MPIITLFIAGLIFILHLIPGSFELLAFHRSDVAQGAWWQLVTSNFVHGSWEHLVRDSSALLCFGPAVEHRLGRLFYLLFAIVSSFCISLGYLLFVPTVEILFGISGVISGLFAVLLMQELPRTFKKRSWVWFTIVFFALIGFSLKLAYESIFNASLLFRNDLGAAPFAHFAGFMTGIFFGLASTFKTSNYSVPLPRASLYVSIFGALSWVGAVLFWP